MSIILTNTDFDSQNTDILLRKMRIISLQNTIWKHIIIYAQVLKNQFFAVLPTILLHRIQLKG